MDQQLLDIIKSVTVDCKDNQTSFVATDRIKAIKDILSHSDYSVVYENGLCIIYGKRELKTGDEIVLISSHIDCVYSKCFCNVVDNEHLHGTFDNSLTNAAVINNMLNDCFDENTFVAFTGDEEIDSKGAHQVAKHLQELDCNVLLTIVTDVSNEGWDDDCHFTIENDLDINIIAGHRIVENLKEYWGKFALIHRAEPDETWDYIKYDYPCLSLCIPVLGNMHSDKGCIARAVDTECYCKAIALIAKALS